MWKMRCKGLYLAEDEAPTGTNILACTGGETQARQYIACPATSAGVKRLETADSDSEQMIKLKLRALRQLIIQSWCCVSFDRGPPR